MAANTWKLQDAKAQFSEVVRKARSGEPQIVTVHGEPAVMVSAFSGSGVKKPDEPEELTMAGFVERSKKYRGLGLKIPRRPRMKQRFDPAFGNDE
jgi:prevent-host-death family protein